MAVAERMGRRAIGIELVAEHLEIARRRAGGGAKLILGDARELSRLVDEPVDSKLTRRCMLDMITRTCHLLAVGPMI